MDKRNYFKTAWMVKDSSSSIYHKSLYPAGTCVGVQYQGEHNGDHYFAIKVAGQPTVIVHESKLADFVL